MEILIVLLLITPLFFAIFSFILQDLAKYLGLIFAYVWLFLAFALLYVVATTGALHYNFAGYPPPLGIQYIASGMSALMLALSAFLLFCVTLYSFKAYEKGKTLYPLLCFLSSGLAVVFLSSDIFNIYVGLEIVGLSAVALSAFTQKSQNIDAAMKYFFATLLGSGFYLLGVALLYAHYGVLDITLLSQKMQSDFISRFVFICIALGLSLKTALFPLHYWLPNAHANAAAPISALLSALIVKASFYLLYIFYFELFDFFAVGEILGYLGIATIFYGGMQALFAKNIKLLIAYSTLSQLGYLFLVFLLNTKGAQDAVLLHIIAHALAKGGLFLASGVIIYYFATKKITALKGLGSTLPLSAFTVALCSVTIIGLPPSLGFFAKWYYLVSAFETKQWTVVISVLLGGVLSGAYLLRLLVLSLQTPNKSVLKSVNSKMLESIAFTLALLSVSLGFFTKYILQIGGM